MSRRTSELVMNRIDIAAAPPPDVPRSSLFAFYRYFLAEHQQIFVWLFICGFGVACADAMVSVFVGKVVAFVGQPDRWTGMARTLADAGRPSRRDRNRPPCPDLCRFTSAKQLSRSRRHLPNALDQPLAGGEPELAVLPERFPGTSCPQGHAYRRLLARDRRGRHSRGVVSRDVWGASAVLLGGADWRLALPIAGWFCGYALLLRYYVPRLRTNADGSSQAYSDLMARIVDCYSNILTIKLFSYAATDNDHVRRALLSHNDTQLRHMRTITGFMTSLTLLNTALLAGTGIIGVSLWLNEFIQAEAVAMALPLVWQLASTGGWVAWEVSGIFQNLADVKQGMESIAAPNTMVDHPDAKTLEIKAGAIEFRQIGFGYSSERPLFEQFTLTLAPGERVGLVGRSGAGKSTLVSLLLRLYDIQDGSILIDGQNIQHVSLDSLRSCIGVVTQDTALLHRSIRDNIMCGKPDATPAELERALEPVPGCAIRIGAA